jgi:hypothetical protein
MRSLPCLFLLGAAASAGVAQATAVSFPVLVSATSSLVLLAGNAPLSSVEATADTIVPDVRLDTTRFAIEIWRALEGADPLAGASPAFGSTSPEDAAPSPPACADSFDNDGDGLSDFPDDPGCVTAGSVTERPRCQDGIDTDQDGAIDFDGGASVNGGVPLAAPDPQCAGAPWRDRERP